METVGDRSHCKRGGERENCESYCPLNILNIDKLFASIIYQIIYYLLPDLMNEDQIGFVKGHQTQVNGR